MTYRRLTNKHRNANSTPRANNTGINTRDKSGATQTPQKHVGGAAGGIIGALVGMGIPEYEAKQYEGKIRGGNTLIAVHTDNSDEEKLAKDIYKRAGAEDIKSTSEASVPS